MNLEIFFVQHEDNKSIYRAQKKYYVPNCDDLVLSFIDNSSNKHILIKQDNFYYKHSSFKLVASKEQGKTDSENESSLDSEVKSKNTQLLYALNYKLTTQYQERDKFITFTQSSSDMANFEKNSSLKSESILTIQYINYKVENLKTNFQNRKIQVTNLETEKYIGNFKIQKIQNLLGSNILTLINYEN